LKIKVVTTDGSEIKSEDANTVATVNNLLHSLFSSLTVSLNEKPVLLHENNYHNKAYLDAVLNYGSDASQTRRVTNFSFLDTPGGDGSLKADTANKGYAKRKDYLKDGKPMVWKGTLHGDLFSSNNLLINGFDVSVNPPSSIYLLGPSDGAKVGMKISDVPLFVTQVDTCLRMLMIQNWS
jgi:hypothetical protein